MQKDNSDLERIETFLRNKGDYGQSTLQGNITFEKLGFVKLRIIPINKDELIKLINILDAANISWELSDKKDNLTVNKLALENAINKDRKNLLQKVKASQNKEAAEILRSLGIIPPAGSKER